MVTDPDGGDPKPDPTFKKKRGPNPDPTIEKKIRPDPGPCFTEAGGCGSG